MPDASRGVPVRFAPELGTYVVPVYTKATHIAYPVALAEARERVVEAAQMFRNARLEYDHCGPDPDVKEECARRARASETRLNASLCDLDDEIAALDALEGADTEGGT